jgi:hypothetical protein
VGLAIAFETSDRIPSHFHVNQVLLLTSVDQSKATSLLLIIIIIILLLLFTEIGFAPGGSSPTLVQTKTIKQHYTVVQHNTIKRKHKIKRT